MAHQDMVHGYISSSMLISFVTFVLSPSSGDIRFRPGKYHAHELLNLVHTDLYGLISPPTPTGHQHLLLMMDAASCCEADHGDD